MTDPKALARETGSTPPFIVVGQWKDNQPIDPVRGQRSHPYGIEAWQDSKNGEVRIYPNMMAALDDGAIYATELAHARV